MPSRWIATFDEPALVAQALTALADLGVPGTRLVSPAPYRAVHLTGQPGPWRAMGWLVLGGGLCGLATAIALEVGTSLAHPMHVGGQPVIAWVQFGVIMFEMTMLGAGLTNFLAMIVLGAWSRRQVAKAARDGLRSDRLTLAIPTSGRSPEQLQAIRAALVGATGIEEAP